MCSNARRSGPPSRPQADLATRLAAAIDELAAVASSAVSTSKECVETDRTDQGRGTQGRGTQEQGARSRAQHDRAELDLSEHDLLERLARAWAMIIAADPAVAARTAHYSGP
jgi:hypothetical protein